MKKNRAKIDRLRLIFKKLFPDYQDIKIKERRDDITIIFCKTKRKIWRILIPKLATTRKSLYETLVTDVPKQLSYRKAMNDSFSTIILLQIAVVLNKGPQYIVEFLEEQLNELPDQPTIGLTDILEETKLISSNGTKDSKLFGGLIKITNNHNILADLLSSIV